MSETNNGSSVPEQTPEAMQSEQTPSTINFGGEPVELPQEGGEVYGSLDEVESALDALSDAAKPGRTRRARIQERLQPTDATSAKADVASDPRAADIFRTLRGADSRLKTGSADPFTVELIKARIDAKLNQIDLDPEKVDDIRDRMAKPQGDETPLTVPEDTIRTDRTPPPAQPNKDHTEISKTARRIANRLSPPEEPTDV